METNKSILMREVVSLEDRKTVGAVKDVLVDCDTQAISHYIIGDPTLTELSVLPKSRVLAVGDAFITITKENVLTPVENRGNQKLVEDGFRLIGTEVFSRAGNRVSIVEAYEFDTESGAIENITLADGQIFTSGQIIFFSPAYVFVDDSGEMVQKAAPAARVVPAYTEPEPEPEPEPIVEEVFTGVVEDLEEAEQDEAENLVIEAEDNTEEAASEDNGALSALAGLNLGSDDSADKEAPVSEDSSVKDNSALYELLLGARVNESVQKDGFEVEKGTVITQQILDEATEKDALLLLTMSVDV